MRHVLIFAFLLASFSAGAAPSKFFSAVLADPRIQALADENGTFLKTISNTDATWCCYEFTLTFMKEHQNFPGDWYETTRIVNISEDSKTKEIKVELKN